MSQNEGNKAEAFPFRKLRIVDASQGIAGPSAASMFARYGADVIKVEPPGGDWSRHRGFNTEGISAQAAAANIGKRSIALDLKRPGGANILRRMIAGADIFIESFRPGVIQRLGFGYPEVKAIKPNIIYTSISGFGQVGPLREKGAIDAVMQAFSGFMTVNRSVADGRPQRVGFFIIDVVAGLYAFQAMAVAAYARMETGQGRFIDCNLLQSALSLQNYPLLLHTAAHGVSEAALTSSPLGTFKTADGWINFAVTKDEIWPKFCDAIGCPAMGADKGLANVTQRRARNDEIMLAISDALVREPSATWGAKLDALGILNQPVTDYETLLHHPQVEAIHAFSWIDQPTLGTVAIANPPGPPPLASSDVRSTTPAVGLHTREILRELDYSDAEVSRLSGEQVVFQAEGAMAAE